MRCLQRPDPVRSFPSLDQRHSLPVVVIQSDPYLTRNVRPTHPMQMLPVLRSKLIDCLSGKKLRDWAMEIIFLLDEFFPDSLITWMLSVACFNLSGWMLPPGRQSIGANALRPSGRLDAPEICQPVKIGSRLSARDPKPARHISKPPLNRQKRRAAWKQANRRVLHVLIDDGDVHRISWIRRGCKCPQNNRTPAKIAEVQMSFIWEKARFAINRGSPVVLILADCTIFRPKLPLFIRIREIGLPLISANG